MIDEILQLVNNYNEEVNSYKKTRKTIEYDADYFLFDEMQSIKKSKQDLEMKLREFIIETVKQEFNL